MTTVRPAAVAGTFYPANPAVLQEHVDALLDAATPSEMPAPKALIVPHAGYIYSGPIAASGYATLRHAQSIRRVVLLGPAHRVYIHGLALPTADAFDTPLGRVSLDLEAFTQVPWVARNAAVHREEHSLEVQLPFLLRALPHPFVLAPFVVGSASPAEVANVLRAVWGGSETLIVISSDLSHYLSYATAQSEDERTAQTIIAMNNTTIEPEQACGATPINGFLLEATKRKLQPKLLDLRNSGDTAGGRKEVVGYVSIAFYEPT